MDKDVTISVEGNLKKIIESAEIEYKIKRGSDKDKTISADAPTIADN